MTPLELVAAYAAFANGGIGVHPHVISRCGRRTAGNLRPAQRQFRPGHRPAIGGDDEQHDARDAAPPAPRRRPTCPGWEAAGKTGTSQDWRDAWFVGYTSHLVAAVWLGNDDGTPTKNVSGGNLPVEIWSRFMRAAHQGVPVAALPSGCGATPETPNPDARLLPPLDLTGAQAPTPLPGGRGGLASQPGAAASQTAAPPPTPAPARAARLAPLPMGADPARRSQTPRPRRRQRPTRQSAPDALTGTSS